MQPYVLSEEEHGGTAFVVVALSGPAERDALLDVLRRLEELAQERGISRVLIDESELDAGFISPLDIRALVEAWSGARAFREARVAVVAPSPVIYGLNRMVQALSVLAEKRIHVFRSREEAIAHLVR